MSVMTESKSIQLWPAGRSIRFSGGYPHYIVHDDDGERPATDEENKSIQANELADSYMRNEIFCCDSALVGDLIQHAFDGERGDIQDAFDLSDEENVSNLRTNPESWDIDDCRSWLDDRRIEYDKPPTDVEFPLVKDVAERVAQLIQEARKKPSA